MKFTEAHLKELKRQGKIRGYKIMNKPREPNGRIVAKAFKKKSKEKEWMEWNLLYICNEFCLQLTQEHKFHPERKFRFDYAVKSLKIAWEWEGIMSEQSRHTNKIGFSKDATKYNEAQKLGWVVLRFTVLNRDEFMELSKKVIRDRLNAIF